MKRRVKIPLMSDVYAMIILQMEFSFLEDMQEYAMLEQLKFLKRMENAIFEGMMFTLF